MENNYNFLQFFSNKLNSKCFRVLKSIDTQITKNFKDGEIVTRPSKSNGLWCAYLLPAILVLYMIIEKVPRVYSLTAYVSVGLLFYSALFTLFLSVSCVVLREPVYGGCAACSLIAVLLVYSLLGEDLLTSIVIAAPSVYVYSSLIRCLMIYLPKTFTIGEAMVVAQGITLFGVASTGKLIIDWNEELDYNNVVVYTVFAGVAMIGILLYLLRDDQRQLSYLLGIVLAAAIIVLTVLHTILGMDFLYTFIEYTLYDSVRSQLIYGWLVLVVLATCMITFRARAGLKATSITRKLFHVLAAAVFTSGVLCDARFMTLAAGCVFGVVVFLEILRKCNIEPVSSALQSAFDVYSDDKDAGALAVTPLYLYAGLSCPLLLAPRCPLELLSGVLSIGVGDTAASYFGCRYGVIKWPGSKRTMEGTAFNIISQIATVYALEQSGLLVVRNAMLRAAFAATASALVEAKTNQVDNLILPLVTILAFQMTRCL